MSDIVEMGLTFCCIRYAANYMARHGVPFAVAHRVLLRPHMRRKTKRIGEQHPLNGLRFR